MVVMGRIVAPYGVHGWVKIQPFTETLDSLLDYEHWWINEAAGWREGEVEEARVHGKVLVAKFSGCDGRDAAFALRGKDVAVSRDELPQAGDGEYYWSDLIGLNVHNLQQENLGQVKEVFATGANDVLVVQNDRERLIPFTSQVVQEVDLAAGRMLVDWDADF
ncbi:MAG: ribosome maturation factor RimM [Methylophilales bacterium RIFCSPHIGHO2_02_FULL_57_10]|nr:MAG: ribosome maturation factor RimM [Methylophilales bacterium RIFCSPHIGHO2_02_FULL_57_10]